MVLLEWKGALIPSERLQDVKRCVPDQRPEQQGSSATPGRTARPSTFAPVSHLTTARRPVKTPCERRRREPIMRKFDRRRRKRRVSEM